MMTILLCLGYMMVIPVQISFSVSLVIRLSQFMFTNIKTFVTFSDVKLFTHVDNLLLDKETLSHFNNRHLRCKL